MGTGREDGGVVSRTRWNRNFEKCDVVRERDLERSGIGLECKPGAFRLVELCSAVLQARVHVDNILCVVRMRNLWLISTGV